MCRLMIKLTFATSICSSLWIQGMCSYFFYIKPVHISAKLQTQSAEMKFIIRDFVFVGSSLSDKVHQNPHDMLENVLESPVLHCSHSISSYNRILWYKQTQDRQLVFLGYLLGSEPQLETEVKNKLALEGNGNDNGKLTIKNLEFNDTGTYFCAASPQCHTCAVSPLQKPADRLHLPTK